MSCENTIEQHVPSGYDYKTITQRCGSTSIHGHAQYCDDCLKAQDKQGHAPNECKHGYNIYGGDYGDEICPHEDCS